jgi:hypothetical protein
MPSLNFTTEQIIELVSQLPAEGEYGILLSLHHELETILAGVTQEGEQSAPSGSEDVSTAKPLLELVGKYKNDEQFQQVLQHIETYRRELDAAQPINSLDEAV